MAVTSPERLVLSVSLDTSKRQAEVCCLLTRNGDRLGEWRCTTEEMGLPEVLDRRKALYEGYKFELPAKVLNDLKGLMEPHRPLWLRLERPSGYLRLVPWEQLLGPRLGVPILRLPDFETEPPRETARALDVVLCGSAPSDEVPFPVVEYLVRIADRILSAVPRRTTLHVFTDGAVHLDLKQRWTAQGKLGSAIQLYSPQTAAPYAAPDPTSRIQDLAGRIESPWLLWIRDSLQERSVDVAHFLCHGYLSQDRGSLAFAESPLKNDERQRSRFVGPAELSAFTTQVGAWSMAFTSPERNYSEMGLRLLADTIAQSRPGPVLHHELRLDPGCIALAQAYQLLYGTPGAPPPVSPALLLYCQPSLLEAPMTRAPTRSFAVGPETPAQQSLRTLYETEENVPAWVAAAERSIEQVKLRLRKTAEAPGQTIRGGTEIDPVQDTLRQIEEIVARAAAKKGGAP